MPAGGGITRLLDAYGAGDRAALDALVAHVYDDLRALAGAQLRRLRGRQTLSVTGVVNEAYLRLADTTRNEWRGREHFFAVCSKAMRQIVISYARRFSADKRGGGDPAVTLDDDCIAVEKDAAMILDVHRAVDALSAIDERLARIIECRFFAGLSEEETAEALGSSRRTVQRDWARARAWLREELTSKHNE